MKLSKIIFNLKNLKGGGVQSDDDRLSDEQLIYIFNYYRARWISQEYNKNRSVLDGMEQSLYKVKVVDLDQDKPLGSGLAIDNLLITEEFPQLIQLNPGLAVSYIGSRDGTNPYQRIRRRRMSFVQHARHTSQEGYWYPQWNRIVLKAPGDESPEFIAIHGVFDDPNEALQFVVDKENADTSPVGTKTLDIDFNYEYPATARQQDAIFKMMMESEIRVAEVLPSDDINDSTDKLITSASR